MVRIVPGHIYVVPGHIYVRTLSTLLHSWFCLIYENRSRNVPHRRRHHPCFLSLVGIIRVILCHVCMLGLQVAWFTLTSRYLFDRFRNAPPRQEVLSWAAFWRAWLLELLWVTVLVRILTGCNIYSIVVCDLCGSFSERSLGQEVPSTIHSCLQHIDRYHCCIIDMAFVFHFPTFQFRWYNIHTGYGYSSRSSVGNVPTSTMTAVAFTRTAASLRGLAKRHGVALDANHAHRVRSQSYYSYVSWLIRLLWTHRHIHFIHLPGIYLVI